MTEPQHTQDDWDFAIFQERQKTKRTIIHWSFASGLFLVFCALVTVAGLTQ